MGRGRDWERGRRSELFSPSSRRSPAPQLPRSRLIPMIRFLLLLSALATAAIAQPAPKQVARAPATATLIPLSENWRLDGDVPVHALLISLQGLANRDQPRVYLEYPKSWQWEIVHPLIGFLA